MAVAPSFQDFLDVGTAELQARRSDLLVSDGDVTLAMVHAAAAMSDAVLRFAAQSFKDTFVDGARGDALTALVDDHYNIQRVPATAAQVTVSFSRTSAGAAGTIPAGTTVATAFDANGNQIQFTTDGAIAVGSGLNGPFDIVATATETGTDTNVIPTAIDSVVDQPTFDPTFAVTNTASAAGGNDAESDIDLRERARSFFSTLRRGTLAALEFGALTVPEVRVAVAVENTNTGEVTMRVTDADGNSTAQMIEDVLLALEDYRCAGSSVLVVGGTKLLTSLEVKVTDFRVGYSVAAAAADIQAAIEARLNKLRVGETLYLDMIVASAIAVSPDDIYNVTVNSITLNPGGVQPIADVVPGAAEVIRADSVVVS